MMCYFYDVVVVAVVVVVVLPFCSVSIFVDRFLFLVC